MALVLVEGEEQIVNILNASNVSTTAQAPAASTAVVNASASQLVTGAHRSAIVVFVAGLVVLIVLL
jgi:hypothetical protein